MKLKVSSIPWEQPQTEEAKVMREGQLWSDRFEIYWPHPPECSSLERSRIHHRVQPVSSRGLTCRKPVEWPPQEMRALHQFDECTRKLHALV